MFQLTKKVGVDNNMNYWLVGDSFSLKTLIQEKHEQTMFIQKALTSTIICYRQILKAKELIRSNKE